MSDNTTPTPMAGIDAEILNEFISQFPTEFNGKGTGARFEEEDNRDHLFQEYLGRDSAEITLPKAKDLRPAQGPIYDQGNLGSCTAQAAVGCDEALRRKVGQPGVRLSRLMNYYMSREYYGEINQDNGATNRLAFKNLITGVAPEDLWPHNLSMWNTRPSTAAYDAAQRYQTVEYLSITSRLTPGSPEWKADIHRQIKTSLAQGHPVAFAMLIHENFEPNWQGIIPFPAGRILGGHAMVIVGYSDYSKNYIIRNSWGNRWGGYRRSGQIYWGGYARIGYAHMEAFGRDYWTLRKVESGAV